MKPIFINIIITSLLISLFTQNLSAQKMYVFLPIDITEGEGTRNDRSDDRSEDYDNSSTFYEQIASACDLDYVEKHYYGNTFDKQRILNDIKRLSCTEKDIIVWNSFTHGLNKSGNLPSIQIGFDLLAMDEIIKMISEKGAKFSLVMVGACNVIPNHNNGVNSNGNSNSGFRFMPDEVKDLFLNFSGRKLVYGTAASRGQFSWSSRIDGSYFGQYFRSAVYNTDENSTWRTIFSDVKSSFRTMTFNIEGVSYKQTPQFSSVNFKSKEDQIAKDKEIRALARAVAQEYFEKEKKEKEKSQSSSYKSTGSTYSTSTTGYGRGTSSYQTGSTYRGQTTTSGYGRGTGTGSYQSGSTYRGQTRTGARMRGTTYQQRGSTYQTGSTYRGQTRTGAGMKGTTYQTRGGNNQRGVYQQKSSRYQRGSTYKVQTGTNRYGNRGTYQQKGNRYQKTPTYRGQTRTGAGMRGTTYQPRR